MKTQYQKEREAIIAKGGYFTTELVMLIEKFQRHKIAINDFRIGRFRV